MKRAIWIYRNLGGRKDIVKDSLLGDIDICAARTLTDSF
jgi:hypothetical protein